jgi:hypothetical protein
MLIVVATHQQCAQTTQNDLLQSGTLVITKEVLSSITPMVEFQLDNISTSFPLRILFQPELFKSQHVVLPPYSFFEFPNFFQLRSQLLDRGQRGSDQLIRCGGTSTR